MIWIKDLYTTNKYNNSGIIRWYSNRIIDLTEIKVWGITLGNIYRLFVIKFVHWWGLLNSYKNSVGNSSLLKLSYHVWVQAREWARQMTWEWNAVKIDLNWELAVSFLWQKGWNTYTWFLAGVDTKHCCDLWVADWTVARTGKLPCTWSTEEIVAARNQGCYHIPFLTDKACGCSVA